MAVRKADSTLRSSQAVPHPSTNRALHRLTSEVGRDPVYSTRYGRQRMQRRMYGHVNHAFTGPQGKPLRGEEEEEAWERRPGAPGGGKGREGIKRLGTPRKPLCEQVIGIALACSTRYVLARHDSLAEWSKALASGASPQGRGFEPHSWHSFTIQRTLLT